MNFKTSLLAASVALILAGCGSDDSTPAVGGDSLVGSAVEGKFIDAAVEGLYYKASPSGKSGFTDAEGTFDFAQGDTVTFFLGGETGLRLGSASARDVISPFTITGNYNKALNLARILQSVDDANDDFITLPDSLKAPGADVLAALNNVQLHDLETANDLKAALNVTDWISQDKALEHLNNSLKDLEQGSKEPIAGLQRGSGKILREVSAQLDGKNASDAYARNYVHADKMMEADLFNATRGMSGMNIQLNEDAGVVLAGSNDSSISESYAALHLTCLSEQGLDAEFTNPSNNVPAQCNGVSMEYNVDQKFELGSHYYYTLINANGASTDDEPETWEELSEFGNFYSCISSKSCSEAKLTGFSITTYEDVSDNGTDVKKQTSSSNFDAITGVYSELTQTDYIDGPHKGRTSNRINFAYLVDSKDSERYVDFKGTWTAVETRPGCDKIAKTTYVFDDTGARVTGDEFNRNCETESMNEHVTYAELAEMDFWWFNTNGVGNESKATLTQLNSTIRWCDSNSDYDAEVGCTAEGDVVKFNRWEYMPAGKNWDLGTLNRRTLDSQGNVTGTISFHKN